MGWTLTELLVHEDANFRRLTELWAECRTKLLPTRRQLSFIKLLPVSGKVVLLDISQTTPKIIYSGSDSLPFFYFDPLGVSLMQAFSYDTFQSVLAALPELKKRQGLMITLTREGQGYELLVLPIADSKGHVIQAVCIGAAKSEDEKEKEVRAIVSSHDAMSWKPVDLKPAA
ncbi:MAG: hypothetical protein EP335_16705 [Alphaproteobacteria bacterium]|nr:MAG: hypothetical protein EP335_16705 [Alphaproteobacteria bacterium]